MKIAIITSGDPNDMKGVMNYVQEKLSRLKNTDSITFDFYMIRHRDSIVFSIIRRKRRPRKDSQIFIDDVKYNNIWIKHSFFDYLLVSKLDKKSIHDEKQILKEVDTFIEYDLIVSHWIDSHYLALNIKNKFSIPFVTTWHGSDINIWPYENKCRFILCKKIIESANCNFFVSNKLLIKSNEISNNGVKDYIYTGPSSDFYKYNNEKIEELKEKYNCKYKRVIGFVGNIIPIKNVLVLPKIFKKVSEVYLSKDLIFWIIGNGGLELKLENELKKISIEYKLFGKTEPNIVPDLMNCMDILILPSLNEGMPLVTLEALACGVNVVGSNVGGIPESIGKENCFDLDDNFVDNISNRIIEILENNEKPKSLSPEFSWEYAIEKEVNTYRKILNCNF